MKKANVTILKQEQVLYDDIECYYADTTRLHGTFTDFNNKLLLNDEINVKFTDGTVESVIINKLSPFAGTGLNEAHFIKLEKG